MDFIDTHCHMDSILERLELPDFAAFKSRYLSANMGANLGPEGGVPPAEAGASPAETGVSPVHFGGCITISCDPDSVEPALALMRSEGVYGAFGIHPHDAKAYGPELEAKLRAAMANPKTLAWGEIGLDYHYNMSPPEVQREVFARQIRMAVESGKPLIIHTREAEADTLEIMEREAPKDWKIHVHCFTSSQDMAERLLAGFPGLCLGFTGIVTFKNAQELQQVAKTTPMDRLLLETDGPYLAPIPYRGKPAHPGHIPFIAQKLAEIKGVPVEEVYAAARENTRRIYGI
ncbi:MAG: hydrolase, TatD family protein [Fibrobacteres bacterium]|nr:hydrolase, TatD family protein [Fibrobacterota bacterium]